MQEIRILERTFLGNSILDFSICFTILLFGFLLKRYGATFLSKQSIRLFKRVSQNHETDQLVLAIRKPVEQFLSLIILYVAFDYLTFPEEWHFRPVTEYGLRWLIYTVWMIAMYVTGGRILLKATDYFGHILAHREESPFSRK